MRCFSWLGVALLVALPSFLRADLKVTPGLQAKLDQTRVKILELARDPVLIEALVLQNQMGPLSEMTPRLWRRQRRSSKRIKAFQKNPAGKLLRNFVRESGGEFSEAFLSAERGEKAAFFEKTTSYIHKGQPKFDVPFGTGEVWQGQPEFDESSQKYQVQISVPVRKRSKTLGVLVVGVSIGSDDEGDLE